MPILRKNVKKEVDRQYNALIKQGYKPVLSEDGESYSWINDKGEKFRGVYDRAGGGIDVDAGIGDVFKPGRRQRRLMSEKVTATLGKKGEDTTPFFDESKSKDQPDTVTSKKGPSASDIQAEEDAAKKLTVSVPGDQVPKDKTYNVPTLIAKSPSGMTDLTKTFIAPIADDKQTIEFYPGRDLLKSEARVLSPKYKMEPAVPIYDRNKPNTDAPFIYYPQEEWQSEHGPVYRLFHNKYGTSPLEVEAAKKGSHSVQDVAKTLPKTKIVGGKKYTMVENPNYKQSSGDRIDLTLLNLAEDVMMPSGIVTKTLPKLAQIPKAERILQSNIESWRNLPPRPAAKVAEETERVNAARAKAAQIVKDAVKTKYGDAKTVAKETAEKAAEVAKEASKTAKTSAETAKETATKVAAKAEETIKSGVRGALPEGNIRQIRALPESNIRQIKALPESTGIIKESAISQYASKTDEWLSRLVRQSGNVQRSTLTGIKKCGGKLVAKRTKRVK